MYVAAAFALEKVSSSLFVEATNARFPFQFALQRGQGPALRSADSTVYSTQLVETRRAAIWFIWKTRAVAEDLSFALRLSTRPWPVSYAHSAEPVFRLAEMPSKPTLPPDEIEVAFDEVMVELFGPDPERQ